MAAGGNPGAPPTHGGMTSPNLSSSSSGGSPGGASAHSGSAAITLPKAVETTNRPGSSSGPHR